jgi:hypothetical protein
MGNKNTSHAREVSWNGNVNSMGLKDGHGQEYNTTTKLTRMGKYRNGICVDIWLTFNENHQLIFVEKYDENGNMITYEDKNQYDPSGATKGGP